jgi:hypothetical protein
MKTTKEIIIEESIPEYGIPEQGEYKSYGEESIPHYG